MNLHLSSTALLVLAKPLPCGCAHGLKHLRLLQRSRQRLPACQALEQDAEKSVLFLQCAVVANKPGKAVCSAATDTAVSVIKKWQEGLNKPLHQGRVASLAIAVEPGGVVKPQLHPMTYGRIGAFKVGQDDREPRVRVPDIWNHQNGMFPAEGIAFCQEFSPNPWRVLGRRLLCEDLQCVLTI